MSKTRNLLSQLLKEWAQSHNLNYTIADNDTDDVGIVNTERRLTWIIEQIKSDKGTLDLLGLLNMLEEFVNNSKKKNKFPDGMFCKNCTLFYEYAEPNQSDGTLLCYSCKLNPY